jgi:arsenate reductase (glutaredoxin)
MPSLFPFGPLLGTPLLRLLTDKGVEFGTVNYLDQPLTAESLKKLLHSAGMKPLEAARSNEPAFDHYIRGKDLSDDELIEVMTKHPEIIQRPIVVRGNKAALARPTERVKELGI